MRPCADARTATVARVLAVDPVAPGADSMAEAARVLCRGGLVAFPTETVYGLGADALSPQAVAGLFAAKGRPSGNPLIVHIADPSEVERLTSEWSPAAQRLAQAFWPGPLTLVAPKTAAVPDVVTAGGPTVALRMPAHPVAAALLHAVGRPVAAPSANRSARISPTCADHVWRQMGDRIDLILDGGPCQAGIESTVIDTTVDPLVILRPGPVTAEAIMRRTGLRVADCVVSPAGARRSPGQMGKHYAPLAVAWLTDRPETLVAALRVGGVRTAWLRLAGDANGPKSVLCLPMPNEAEAYGAVLYARLHRAEIWGAQAIVITRPPGTPPWAAIHDRLRRATQA